MKSRFLAITLTFVLLLSLIPAAGAQDDCFGLSADDCAILTNAGVAMEGVTSFAMSYDFSLTTSGIASLDPSSSDITVTSTGSGSFAMVEGGAVPITLEMSLDGAVDTGAESESGSISFVIVDDFFYLQDPESGEWLGFDLASAMEMGVTDALGVPFDPTMLESGAGMEQLGPALGMLGALPGLVTQERLADEEMMGQSMYAFQTAVDFAVLLDNQDFMDGLMQGVMESAGGGDDMAFAAAMLGQLLPFADADLSIVQWVGADDGYVHRAVITVDLSLDLGAAMEVEDVPPVAFNISLDVQMSDFNADFAVAAPENFTLIDPETGMPLGQ